MTYILNGAHELSLEKRQVRVLVAVENRDWTHQVIKHRKRNRFGKNDFIRVRWHLRGWACESSAETWQLKLAETKKTQGGRRSLWTIKMCLEHYQMEGTGSRGLRRSCPRFAEETQGRMELGEPTDLREKPEKVPLALAIRKRFWASRRTDFAKQSKTKRATTSTCILVGNYIKQDGKDNFFLLLVLGLPQSSEKWASSKAHYVKYMLWSLCGREGRQDHAGWNFVSFPDWLHVVK